MDDALGIIFGVGIPLFGLPWLILHYITKWKTRTPVLSGEDEKLLDDMYNLARRLEERLETVERIVAADNPDFRPVHPSARTDHDYSRRN